jgi:hypothetical protein
VTHPFRLPRWYASANLSCLTPGILLSPHPCRAVPLPQTTSISRGPPGQRLCLHVGYVCAHVAYFLVHSAAILSCPSLCMYVCIYVCMYIRMYVCMYVYVYTCYVLTKPPMPIHYVLAAVFASCFYVLKSLLHE